MSKTKFVACVLIGMGPSLLLSQYALGPLTPDQRTILNNTRSLAVRLEMDRTEYLPGEVATVKITVKNDMDHAIEVMKPFDPSSAGLDMLVKLNLDPTYKVQYGPLFMNAHGSRPMDWGAPLALVWMAAGETQETTVSTMDKRPAWRDFAFGHGSVPEKPGEYAAEYSLQPGTMAKFRVIPVVIEQLVSGQLPNYFYPNRPAKSVGVPTDARAAILRSGERRFLVVTAHARSDRPVPKANASREATVDQVREISPFLRLAEFESAAPQFLEVSGPENDRVTVRWQEAGGRRHSLLLDEHRQFVKAEQ